MRCSPSLIGRHLQQNIPHMDTALNQDFLDLYANLMTEIKERIQSWRNICAAPPELLASMPRGIEEFGYLQLRMICELIALGCLAAHNANRAAFRLKIKQEWNAADIMDALHRLHADFFPVPLRWTGPGPLIGEPYPKPHEHLTRESIEQLYVTCGSHLHRGSLRKLLRAPPHPEPNLTVISDWMDKIIELLKLHQIVLSDRKIALTIRMRTPPDGRVMGGAHRNQNYREWLFWRLLPFRRVP
jgi:hypothetical protein